MTTSEPRLTNSEDLVSWKAHREAELFVDPLMVDELAEYLQYELNHDRRKAAYFILGKLGRTVRSGDCAAVLLAYVSKENNKYVLSNLLDALGGVRKPGDLDLTPVFLLLEDKRWLVRHSAIEALKGADSPEVEDRLLSLLKKTSDPHDMTYCQAVLNEIGSTKAIPLLEKNLNSRKRDVKMSAESAIQAIKAREINKNRG
jgi:HEAT repeat protein